jgi:hypothetical protein
VGYLRKGLMFFIMVPRKPAKAMRASVSSNRRVTLYVVGQPFTKPALNREFTVTPAAPKSKPEGLEDRWHQDSRRVYNTLLITLHIIDVVGPGHTWRPRLQRLLGALPANFVLHMGFPADAVSGDL